MYPTLSVPFQMSPQLLFVCFVAFCVPEATTLKQLQYPEATTLKQKPEATKNTLGTL